MVVHRRDRSLGGDERVSLRREVVLRSRRLCRRDSGAFWVWLQLVARGSIGVSGIRRDG